MQMTDKEYIRQLEAELESLREANKKLIARNLELSDQLDIYYETRRRVMMYKELVLRHSAMLKSADQCDDEELLGLIEARLEQTHDYTSPQFGLKEMAAAAGVSEKRVLDLFKRTPLYKSFDDYIDYMRMLHSMFLLQTKPNFNVASCALDSGFTSVRTFYRKFQDVIGLTPTEFRQLTIKSAEKKSGL